MVFRTQRAQKQDNVTTSADLQKRYQSQARPLDEVSQTTLQQADRNRQRCSALATLLMICMSERLVPIDYVANQIDVSCLWRRSNTGNENDRGIIDFDRACISYEAHQSTSAFSVDSGPPQSTLAFGFCPLATAHGDSRVEGNIGDSRNIRAICHRYITVSHCH